MTWTQTTVTLLDGGTPPTPRTFIAYTDGANFALAHPLVDDAGAIVNPADHATLASILAALQAALPLPTGAATAAAQATAATALAAIEAALQAALPLPTGASTAAGQTTANASLAAIQAALGSVGLAPHSAVLQAGSTGTDFSSTPAAVPGAAALVTIPVNANRAYVEVQNQSGAMIQVVKDDGAGGNQTSIFLAAVGAGLPGGGWTSFTHKGRVRVFGAAGSQIAAYQD